MWNVLKFSAVCLVAVFVSGCGTTSRKPANPADNITIGTVQRFIKNGMHSSEVVAALGSPNMVTRNKDGNETWVYDKISSNYEIQQSDSGISIIFLGRSHAKMSSSSGERTLTIIIHFDSESKVSDFSYRTTTF